MEKEFSKIEELLESEAEKINPPAENLKFILERLPRSVTKHDAVRNIYTRANKGRVLEAVIHDLNFFMTNIWKTVLSVSAIAAVIVAVGFWRMNAGQQGDAERGQNMAVTPQAEQAPSIEFASSEVNSAIDELADDVGDAAVIEAEIEDDSSADSDSQPLDNFDTITNYYE